MQKTGVQSLGWEDPSEEEMATYFSIHVWKIPWAEEDYSPCGQRVSHDWATENAHAYWDATEPVLWD